MSGGVGHRIGAILGFDHVEAAQFKLLNVHLPQLELILDEQHKRLDAAHDSIITSRDSVRGVGDPRLLDVETNLQVCLHERRNGCNDELSQKYRGGKQNSTDDSIRRHMTTLETQSPEAHQGAAATWLPALLLLFIGSGCAALIYEVVWFQLLQLSIGSSAVSLGVLLGIYMGGMCLGSLLLPRYVPPDRHPLRVYAYLELGIGAFGVVVLYAVPFLGSLYTQIAGSGPASLILRALVASICLLPPTLLMAAP